jgi:DNA (cytosine-5)-methyltransferase 1
LQGSSAAASPAKTSAVAGQRAGLAGERSGLFFEFARIIDAFRPRWVLVENVPGLLSSNGGRDFGVVLGTLADLGYGVGWRVLDSRFFGVPQRRRRVFIVGARADGDPRAAAERAGEVLAVGSRCDRHPAARGEAGPDVAVASLSGLGSGGPDDNDAWVARAGDYAAGLSASGRHDAIHKGATVRRLTPVECERLQGFPDGWTDVEWQGKPAADSRRYAALGDAVTVPVAQFIGERIARAAA